jgi:hypothetical protein
LNGLLRDNLGHGLSNVTVKASHYDPGSGWTEAATTTDASGHFSFSAEDGSWNVEAAPAELNALGYLSVSSQYVEVSGNATIRFTTRQLDFTHRIAGQLADEAGIPLDGYSLRARITENNALFETNLVTGANGSFLLFATPAVWTFSGLTPPTGVSTVRVLGETPVEVEVTNIEKQVTITAPTATSTILVTTTNLGGWEIAVETEAFGRSYRLLTPVPVEEESPLAIEVFNGAWRVSVTNSDPNRLLQPVTPPAPLLVAVTNQGVSLTLVGITTPGPTLYSQRVRLVTAGGAAVTNAALSVSSGAGFPNYPLPPQPQPPQPNGTPGVFELRLAQGRWKIIASTRNYPVFAGWDVSREVVITTNLLLPEVTLVFPEPGVGARIFGTLSASGGPPSGSHLVSFQLTESGTNYLASLLTDGLGRFGTNVPPGRWEVQTYANCPLASAVVVSNQDVEVNFQFSVPVPGEPIPVSLSVVDDRGEPAPDAWVNLSGFDYQSLPADPLQYQPLPPAIWSVSLESITYVGGTPTFLLSPFLNWQLSPGVTATNLVLVTRHTTSRIEGRLRDEQGRLLTRGYAAAWTSVNGTNFWAYGEIAAGYFSLNVFPGEWQVGAAASDYPTVGPSSGLGRRPSSLFNSATPQSYYTRPAARFVQVINDVVRCEFVTSNIPVPLTLTVTVLREDGGPVDGLNIFANGPVTSQYSPADLNGKAQFSITPGPHRISARPGVYEVVVDPQLWPVLYADVSAPSNHIVLVARQPVTCIPGHIFNANSLGLQPQLFASADINGTNYSIIVCPDTDGDYCAPVFPGQWTVAMNSSTLPGNGIQSVAPRVVTVPPAGAPPRSDFTLNAIAGDFRTARFLSPVLLSDGRLRLELEGQAPLSWRIERSENLREWTLVAIQSAAYRTLVVEEPPEPSRRAAFYRAVWVR